MEQTAVEWLTEEFRDIILKEYGEVRFLELVEHAKEMEEQRLEKLKDFDTWKEWKNKTN
jgi:hypothetical protein